MAQLRDLTDIDLQDQIATLRKELGGLKKVVARRGAEFYEDAGDTLSDYASEIADRINPYLPAIRRQARNVQKAAYDNPALVAAVGLVVLGLVASFAFGGRSRPEPAAPARKPRPNARRRSNSA